MDRRKRRTRREPARRGRTARTRRRCRRRHRQLRGHVALARGDAMDARAGVRRGRAGRSAPTASRRPAASGGLVRVAVRRPGRADARGQPAPPARGCRRTTKASRRAQRTSRWAWRSCSRARRRGPRTLRTAVAMDGYVEACPRAPAARALGDRGAALPARDAHRAGVDRASARLGARARRAGALPTLLHQVGRDAATTDRWSRGPGSYLEAAELAHHNGPAGRGMRSARRAGLARRSRRA